MSENVAGGKIKLKTRGKKARKKNYGRAYIDFRRTEDSRAHTRHRPTTSATVATVVAAVATTTRRCTFRAETRARVPGYIIIASAVALTCWSSAYHVSRITDSVTIIVIIIIHNFIIIKVINYYHNVMTSLCPLILIRSVSRHPGGQHLIIKINNTKTIITPSDTISGE